MEKTGDTNDSKRPGITTRNMNMAADKGHFIEKG